jgi:hypothetical protein
MSGISLFSASLVRATLNKPVSSSLKAPDSGVRIVT